jgi:hypothetical protein
MGAVFSVLLSDENYTQNLLENWEGDQLEDMQVGR